MLCALNFNGNAKESFDPRSCCVQNRRLVAKKVKYPERGQKKRPQFIFEYCRRVALEYIIMSLGSVLSG